MIRPAAVGGGLAAGALLVALLAPLLASEAPLVARVEGKVCFPALAAYPLVGTVAECPHAYLVDWRRERVADAGSILLDAPVPFGPESPDLEAILQSPSRGHWMGTDPLGRDVAARLIHGFPVALAVGGLATLLALGFGLAVGAIAGVGGARLDLIVSRFIDLMACFPTLVLALALAAAADRPGLWSLILAISATRWTGIARLFRAEVLRQRGLGYLQAARAAGAGPGRLIGRHVLPNALAPILVTAAFSVSHAILLEAGMSFLGIGVPPQAASWGGILAEAQRQVEPSWWLVAFPSLALFGTILGCNLLAEGIRRRADPGLSPVG